MTSSSASITQLLLRWRDGDPTALDELTPLVYQEMHQFARYYMGRERIGHTLQASALVNEAYLRLVDHKGIRWKNRAHFYAVAAQAMRHILVDHARTRNCAKRGGGVQKVTLDQADGIDTKDPVDLIALDDALTELTALDSRQAKIVELRYFGGMSVDEIARALGVSQATVMRDWRAARAWLFRAINRKNNLAE